VNDELHQSKTYTGKEGRIRTMLEQTVAQFVFLHCLK